MIPCERYAQYTLLRDASFFAVAAVTLMIGFSFIPALALDIGASVALVFAVVQLFRVSRLTEERFMQGEVWLSLRADERPAGEQGVRVAFAATQDLMLRFARSAAGAAIVMFGFGLALSATIGHDGL
ncbi:MAG: hypothetical protein KIT48_10405 [Pseudolabrys sp.]|nr:hypothetical protein [Pseudolabrys sp.]